MRFFQKIVVLFYRIMVKIYCAFFVYYAFYLLLHGGADLIEVFKILLFVVLGYKFLAPLGERAITRFLSPSRKTFASRISEDLANMLKEFLMSTVTPSASDYVPSSNEANDRAWRQYQARNNAIFHENQAKKYAGTYDGYRHANQAKQAWSDSKK